MLRRRGLVHAGFSGSTPYSDLHAPDDWRCAFHMFVELQQQGQMAIFTGYAPYCNLHSVMCSNNAIFVSLLAVSRFF